MLGTVSFSSWMCITPSKHTAHCMSNLC